MTDTDYRWGKDPGPDDPQDGDPQDPADLPGASWRPADLTDTIAGLIAGTVTRHAPTVGIRSDGACLFYAGKVNGVAGTSGSGKTWTALVSAAQEVDAGHHVLFIDLEDDVVGIVGRLLDLGADPAGVLARFHYIHPEEAIGLAGAGHVLSALGAWSPSLVIIDSTGESMALEGSKPNDDDDTARWFRRIPGPIARSGAAVVVLDHMVKADDGGLWPIGSQRKRAAISGAQYIQTTVRPFDQTTDGLAKIVCAKDRHGNYRGGEKVAEFAVTHPLGWLHIELRAPTEVGTASTVAGSVGWRPTGIMERISGALEAAGESLSFRAIDELASGKAEHKRIALLALEAEGFLTVAEGPRNAKLHTHVRRYEQAADPRSDLYTGPGHTQPPNDRVSVSVSLEGDTGHTHSTVSGTRSGHGGTQSHAAPVLPLNDNPAADGTAASGAAFGVTR